MADRAVFWGKQTVKLGTETIAIGLASPAVV